MNKKYFTVEKEFRVEFYDVDSMNIVYHGNYVNYMEVGRCALLNAIGYNYLAMKEDGYSFPVVDIKLKYMKPLHFDETAKIVSTITEYENCLKISYEIFNSKGELATRAESTQMVVKEPEGETMFVCPDKLIKKVQEAIALKNS